MNQDKNERIGWGLSILLHLILFIVLAVGGFFNYLEQQKTPSMVDVIYSVASGSGSASGSVSSDSPTPASDIALSKPEQSTTQPEEQKITPSDSKQKERPSQTATTVSKTGSNSSNGESDGAGKGQSSTTADGIKGNSQSGGDSDGGVNLEPATPPHVLSRTNPAYPEEVRRQGINGSVSIRAVIGKDGSIEATSITASSGSAALDQAALMAFHQWSFAPAKNAQGRSVRCYVSQRFSFHLD